MNRVSEAVGQYHVIGAGEGQCHQKNISRNDGALKGSGDLFFCCDER